MGYLLGKAPGKAEELTIKLDSAKKPQQIDLTPLAGPNEGKTALGIYTIEGDALKICAAEGGVVERPTEFKVGKEVGIITFKRVKD
jgi:uncharacterized protein (TIGR03067 family)